MSQAKLYLFALATVLLVGGALPAELGEHDFAWLENVYNYKINEPTEKLLNEEKVVKVKHGNLELEAPLYDPDRGVFNERRRKYDYDVFVNATNIVIETSRQVFTGRKWTTTILGAATKKIIGFISKVKKEYREFREDDDTESLAKTYPGDMKKLLEAVFKHIEGPNTTKLNGEQAHQQVVKSLEGMAELVRVSPVGTYLDWNKLKINGLLLAEYEAPVLKRLKEKRPLMLNIFKTVASLF